MSENSRKHVRWSDGYDIPSALPGGQLSSRMQAVGRVCKLKEMCANPFLYDVVKCCKLNMCLPLSSVTKSWSCESDWPHVCDAWLQYGISIR